MARPYSADLRDRVLLAHEHGDGGATALARRFRLGISTLYPGFLTRRRCAERRLPQSEAASDTYRGPAFRRQKTGCFCGVRPGCARSALEDAAWGCKLRHERSGTRLGGGKSG